MSQVKISQLAYADINRIYEFLVDNNAEQQAKTVVGLLNDVFKQLERLPQMGKKYLLTIDGKTLENVRENKIRFGKGGYSFLHRYDDSNDTVLILTIKHYREKSYQL
ncbi:MAG: type II toxin-antitoxin system RelE/ParE family toxin [Gammaproteobacteria bacterium]|nr:type II toxin-antitoxin system RelE/ParE family toxin [Gammaproteobacteria bacterium]